MAERITIGQLIVGHGTGQRIIPPNTRFNTEDFGISEPELRKLDSMVPPMVRHRQDFRSIRPDEAVEAAVAEVAAAQPPARPVRSRMAVAEDDEL